MNFLQSIDKFSIRIRFFHTFKIVNFHIFKNLILKATPKILIGKRFCIEQNSFGYKFMNFGMKVGAQKIVPTFRHLFFKMSRISKLKRSNVPYSSKTSGQSNFVSR